MFYIIILLLLLNILAASTNESYTSDIQETYFTPESIYLNYSKPIIILTGYRNFQRPKLNLATLSIFFKRIRGPILTERMHFSFYIEYYTNESYGNLKQDGISFCSRVTPEEDENIQYNCSLTIHSFELKYIYRDSEFYFEDIPYFEIICVNESIEYSDLSNNIFDDNINYSYLNNIVIKENGMEFTLIGNLSNKQINNNDLFLCLYGNSYEYEMIFIYCRLDKIWDLNQIELECSSSVNLRVQLNDAWLYSMNNDIIFIDTTENIFLNTNINSIFVFIGIGNFFYSVNYIKYNIYLYKIEGNAYPKYLTTVFNQILKNNRKLEFEAFCERISDNNDDINILYYDCSSWLFEYEYNYQISLKNIYFDKNDNTYSIIYSPLSTETINNKQNVFANEIENINIFKDPELNIDEQKFSLVGILDDFNENNIALFINNKIYNRREIINCTSTKNMDKIKLECKPNNSIIFTLNNTVGESSKKLVLIYFNKKINDTIEIDYPTIIPRKDSGGVNAGLIVIIIIACIVFLLGIIFCIILINKYRNNISIVIESQILQINHPYKINKNSKLSSLKKKLNCDYSEKLTNKELFFLSKGTKIEEDKTFSEYGITNGDHICLQFVDNEN